MNRTEIDLIVADHDSATLSGRAHAVFAKALVW
jgi:hypothetical protein